MEDSLLHIKERMKRNAQNSLDGSVRFFYELIQVSIGQRTSLSHIPSVKEWEDAYYLAKKQALIGVSFIGIQYLYNSNPVSIENISKELLQNWLKKAMAIVRQNGLINGQCKIIEEQFNAAGLQTCILKGQGVASYYNTDVSQYRHPGDIDVWVNGSWKEVMDYVNSRTPNREFDMKHTHLMVFPHTTVEVHWWPSMPINPCYKRALQLYFRQQACIQCNHKVKLYDGTIINAPDAKFEIVHVLYHIFNHFLYEGIGLRQIMDLYFVLVNGKLTNNDRDELLVIFRQIGLKSFTPAVMWVLKEVFNIKNEHCIGDINESLGRILLREIEDGGNFGFYSLENRIVNETFPQRMKRRLKRRIRLIRYNPIGVFTSPFVKLKAIVWKGIIIKKYSL